VRFHNFRYFEKDTISNGATYEDSWTAIEDVVIHRIYLARKSGASFTDSTFYLEIDGYVPTKAVVPCITLGPDVLTNPVLDIPFRKGQTLRFILKNLEGDTISVMVTLELWKE